MIVAATMRRSGELRKDDKDDSIMTPAKDGSRINGGAPHTLSTWWIPQSRMTQIDELHESSVLVLSWGQCACLNSFCVHPSGRQDTRTGAGRASPRERWRASGRSERREGCLTGCNASEHLADRPAVCFGRTDDVPLWVRCSLIGVKCNCR